MRKISTNTTSATSCCKFTLYSSSFHWNEVISQKSGGKDGWNCSAHVIILAKRIRCSSSIHSPTSGRSAIGQQDKLLTTWFVKQRRQHHEILLPRSHQGGSPRRCGPSSWIFRGPPSSTWSRDPAQHWKFGPRSLVHLEATTRRPIKYVIDWLLSGAISRSPILCLKTFYTKFGFELRWTHTSHSRSLKHHSIK